ncbi:hypothetical protein NQ318_010868 [Aromia moschata]|uniref:Uncharacterized protein n=1 Tax=Aromia moschata TaxID=1265417 RepID=A0AAV8XTG2_9CUCU|nr:hypothetical protein NQ318_010868 [Aromia moschata]
MNKAVALCALLAAAVAVSAYNFEDPEFNLVLARDLEDIYDSYVPYSHPRLRRDDDAVTDDDDKDDKDEKDKCRPWRRKPKWCCADDVLEKLHDKDKDIRRSCFREITGKDKPDRPKFDPFRCEDVEKHRKEMICIMQCVGQKHGLYKQYSGFIFFVCLCCNNPDIFQLDGDGNPKEEEFGAFVKQYFGTEPWLAALQDKIISTCLSEGKNGTAAADAGSCNPAPAKTAHCLFREIQLSCPAEEIKDEKSCARVRERMKSQDFWGPPPPPPGPSDGMSAAADNRREP